MCGFDLIGSCTPDKLSKAEKSILIQNHYVFDPGLWELLHEFCIEDGCLYRGYKVALETSWVFRFLYDAGATAVANARPVDVTWLEEDTVDRGSIAERGERKCWSVSMGML